MATETARDVMRSIREQHFPYFTMSLDHYRNGFVLKDAQRQGGEHGTE